MDPIDIRRCKFIRHLQSASENQRAHLLGIEDDVELAALKRVALEQQWFEVAASIVTEIKRRATEILVK